MSRTSLWGSSLKCYMSNSGRKYQVSVSNRWPLNKNNNNGLVRARRRASRRNKNRVKKLKVTLIKQRKNLLNNLKTGKNDRTLALRMSSQLITTKISKTRTLRRKISKGSLRRIILHPTPTKKTPSNIAKNNTRRKNHQPRRAKSGEWLTRLAIRQPWTMWPIGSLMLLEMVTAFIEHLPLR